jgi:hypothetical protein
MRWVTLSHVHLDRVATPWLIRRFVDPSAEFSFIERGVEPPADAVPFGMPGVDLSSYDENGTTFSKVITAHGLNDPALLRMERILAAGVQHALGHTPPVDQPEDERTLGGALDSLGLGLGVTYDDAEHIERAMPLYEALYILCRIRLLPEEIRARIPASAERIEFIRAALAAH